VTGECASCGCTETSCETKVWLSGRKCCDDCNHDRGAGKSSRNGHLHDPALSQLFLSPRHGNVPSRDGIVTVVEEA
jgi:hypothetical protein